MPRPMRVLNPADFPSIKAFAQAVRDAASQGVRLPGAAYGPAELAKAMPLLEAAVEAERAAKARAAGLRGPVKGPPPKLAPVDQARAVRLAQAQGWAAAMAAFGITKATLAKYVRAHRTQGPPPEGKR